MSARPTPLAALAMAVAAYDRAAALARFLPIRAADDLVDERWIVLAFRAHVCGYASDDPGDTCVDWARRRIARVAGERPAEQARSGEAA